MRTIAPCQRFRTDIAARAHALRRAQLAARTPPVRLRMQPPWHAVTLSLAVALAACSTNSDDTGRGLGGAEGVQSGGATGAQISGDATGARIDDASTQGAMQLRGEECARVTQTTDNTRQPVDVIWAIDNGGGIQESIEFIRANMSVFSEQIVSSGVDAHTVLITDALDPDVVSTPSPITGIQSGDWRSICVDEPLGSGDCPDDTKLPNFFHLDENVGIGYDIPGNPDPWRHPLNLFISLYDQYRHALRPQAVKIFVVVTDTDALEPDHNSAAAFTQSVAQLEPGMFDTWKLSGVVAHEPCPPVLVDVILNFASLKGQVYIDLAAQTGGITGDYCTQDFEPVFDDIAAGVVASSQLDCSWNIPEPPAGETFDSTKVNVIVTSDGAEQQFGNVLAPADCSGVKQGWHYDDPAQPSAIEACPQTCDFIRGLSNARLDILLGCDTVIAGPD